MTLDQLRAQIDEARSANLARFLDGRGLVAEMAHVLPGAGDRFVLVAAPSGATIYLLEHTSLGVECLASLTALEAEAWVRLFDRGRMIVETGVGDLR